MLRVVVEDLVASASAVSGHGEDLAAAYGAADACLDAVRPGWQGRSGVALAALGERWSELGMAVVVRLSGIAEGLFSSARSFHLHDQDGSDALSGRVVRENN